MDTDSSLYLLFQLYQHSTVATVSLSTYLPHCKEVAVARAWEESGNLFSGGQVTFVFRVRNE